MVETVPFKEEMLERINKAANRNLSEDTISDNTFKRLTILDPNFERKYALVALDQGIEVGFLLGARRTRAPEGMVEIQKETAWVKLFFVEKNRRRFGIGSQLFTEFETIMRKEGIGRIRISDYPAWNLTSGLDMRYEEAIAFLSKRGYRKVGETVDYEIDLLDFYVPTRIITLDKGDVTTRRAEQSDRMRVIEWVEKEFSIFWRVEADRAFNYEKPKIWIAEQGNRVIGFSVYSAFEPSWFGPIGVDPDVRTKGIGSVLLFNSLKDMREEGQRIAVVPWTNHLFFYAQVPGIRRIRHYWIMEKDLKA